MKITEILVEHQQMDEGPLLNKIGAGIGKVAGTVAKGVGAVAGGVAGVGAALKKGYQAGKATVGSGGDEADPAAPPAGGTAAPAAGGFVKKAFNAGKNSVGGGAPAAGGDAPAAGSTAAPAAGSTAAGSTAAPAAGGTAYAQIKANLDKLDKKGKQRILATLQKEIGAAPAAPGAAPAAGGGAPAKPAKPAAGGGAPAKPAAGGGAMANMANQLGGNKPNTMANAPVSATNTAASTTAAGSPPKKPNLRTPMALQQKPPAGAAPAAPAAEPAADEPNYNTQTGVASPAQMKKNREAGKAEAPYGFNQKTGKPNPKPASEPGATTTTPSGEKVLANPVATVGTKRATNIGEPTFDMQTGKPLPGQALNAVRKQAEYGSNTLGKVRQRIKAKAPAAQESIDADRRRIMGTSKPANTREKVSESFSLFRKR